MSETIQISEAARTTAKQLFDAGYLHSGTSSRSAEIIQLAIDSVRAESFAEKDEAIAELKKVLKKSLPIVEFVVARNPNWIEAAEVLVAVSKELES